MEQTDVVVGNTRIALQPNGRGELTATLGRALEAILVPLGFTVKRDPYGDDFSRTRGDMTLTISGAGYEEDAAYACDVVVSCVTTASRSSSNA
jgi:hypothetical protein